MPVFIRSVKGPYPSDVCLLSQLDMPVMPQYLFLESIPYQYFTRLVIDAKVGLWPKLGDDIGAKTILVEDQQTAPVSTELLRPTSIPLSPISTSSYTVYSNVILHRKAY